MLPLRAAASPTTSSVVQTLHAGGAVSADGYGCAVLCTPAAAASGTCAAGACKPTREYVVLGFAAWAKRPLGARTLKHFRFARVAKH